MREENNNKTPHKSSEYDQKVRKTIPFYECFHHQTIDLIRTINPNVKRWLDTGCGTGYLVGKAIKVFSKCRFVLVDPSAEMMAEAKKRLEGYKNVEYLNPIKTEDMDVANLEDYDVVTAIQTHHYLKREDRIKATGNCYNLLREDGIYIVFENIKPENDAVLDIQLERWMNFQLLEGRSEKEVNAHRKRFGVKYFPIKVSEHLSLLYSTGFKIVETLWLSYLQAGFFCLK